MMRPWPLVTVSALASLPTVTVALYRVEIGNSLAPDRAWTMATMVASPSWRYEGAVSSTSTDSGVGVTSVFASVGGGQI